MIHRHTNTNTTSTNVNVQWGHSHNKNKQIENTEYSYPNDSARSSKCRLNSYKWIKSETCGRWGKRTNARFAGIHLACIMCFHQIKIRLVRWGIEYRRNGGKQREHQHTYAILRQNIFSTCTAQHSLLLYIVIYIRLRIHGQRTYIFFFVAFCIWEFVRRDIVVCIWMTASNNILFLVASLPSSSSPILLVLLLGQRLTIKLHKWSVAVYA